MDKHFSEFIKGQIIALRASGSKLNKIPIKVGVSVSTLSDFLKRSKKWETLKRKRGSDRFPLQDKTNRQK